MSFLSDIVNRAQNQLQKNKSVINNIKYLGILQVFNLILPFISYPYLINVLGGEIYGKIIFAQMVISYFSLFIDFGFKLSATKEIASNKGNINEIVSAVIILKLALWIISLILLFFLLSFVDFFKENALLYLFTFTLCFNELLFPVWFFQGMERMKHITIINLSVKAFFTVLIFVFVNTKTDFLRVPLIQGVGAIIGGVWGFLVMIKKYSVKLYIPPLRCLIQYFKDSSFLFFSYLIISFKDRFNVFFIGISLSMTEVAVYDLALKIINIVQQPIDIIVNGVYPKISKEKKIKMVFLYAKITFGFMLFVTFAFYFMTPFLVEFLGKGKLSDATFISRILLICPLLLSWSLHLGRNGLLAFGKNRLYLIGMFISTFVYFILIFIVYLFSLNTSLYVFALISILVYLTEIMYRTFVVYRMSKA